MRLAFASELKALAWLPGFPDQPDARALSRFLAFGYVPDPETIYAGARKLAPGHSLTLDFGSGATRDLTPRRYWAPRFEPDNGLRWETAVEEIHALSAAAVE